MKHAVKGRGEFMEKDQNLFKTGELARFMKELTKNLSKFAGI
ncbi:hypothetical protein [Neobacillus soli]|nr:hypothetical protein [Neobacillus soli]